MKILYAVQATGNGHVSRAMELIPHLENYGTVDVFLSGANSTLPLDAPVKFRSRGLSLFYNCKGGLDFSRIFRQLSLTRIRKEIMDLPVENYDLVLNDFDCITALACARKKISSHGFGHQASFMSANTPRPSRISRTGEWILRNYARATHYTGLHFEQFDDFILPPVIKKEIFYAEPRNEGYITVYLPSYCKPQLIHYFGQLKDHRFQIFSWQVSQKERSGNITFLPVSKNGFDQSMINCRAVICGAGFETPAEVLYLNKKLMVLPIKGQYEQSCNGAALQRMGVQNVSALNAAFPGIFKQWIESDTYSRRICNWTTSLIVEKLMQESEIGLRLQIEPEHLSVDDLINAGL